MSYPNISILLPIYERSKFKPLIISNLLRLDYDLSKLELVISDDSLKDPLFKNDQELIDFKAIVKPIQVNYLRTFIHISIGDKRNFLVKNSKYKICANLDSDDLFLSDWLKHSIDIMYKGKHGLVGTPQMLFCFPKNDFKVTGIECPQKRQIHECGMVFTKKHHKAMGGFAKKCSQGEGCSLIDGMQDERIGKSEVSKCLICICWSGNTINKDRFLLSQEMDINLDDYDKQLILRCLE